MQKRTKPAHPHPLLTLLMLPAVLAGCSSVAEMAGYDTERLNQAAAKQYRQIIRIADGRYRLDTESDTARRVHTIFQRMQPIAEQHNQTGVPFEWQIAVIRSDTPNAWSLPGGKIAINSGLVEQLALTDDEIAAIIGHEMAHALHEDGKKAAGSKLLKRWGGYTVGIAVQAATGFSGGLVQLGTDVLGHYGASLPYSRRQEKRADETGLKLLTQAGYQPQAAVSVWEKMSRAQTGQTNTNSLLSTHPNHEARRQNLERLLPKQTE